MLPNQIYFVHLFIPGHEPGELDIDALSPAESLENARSASGKFGGVAGVFAGVIYNINETLSG